MRSLEDCPPRIGTPRDLNYPTKGHEVVKIIEALVGKEAHPWHVHVCDVACEYDPDTGLYRYRDVWDTAPRQSAKTTLGFAKATHRALTEEGSHTAWTAQSGKDARQKWEKELEPQLRTHFKKYYRFSKVNGREAINWRNGSSVFLVAKGSTAGHGGTIDEHQGDETFADQDTWRDDFVEPAMVTKRNAQNWKHSTTGEAGQSPEFDAMREAGEKVVARQMLGEFVPIAFFDWSAADGVDVFDEDTWIDYMPALGRSVQVDTLRKIRDKHVLNGRPEKFARPYGNRSDTPGGGIYSTAQLAAVLGEYSCDMATPVFAVHLTEDNHGATIAISDGEHLSLATHMPAANVVEWLNERCRKYNTQVTVAARTGAAALEGLERVRVEPKLNEACQAFDLAMKAGTLKIRDHEMIGKANECAEKQHSGETWRWAQKKSNGDISALWALTLAHAAPKARRSAYEERGLRVIGG